MPFRTQYLFMAIALLALACRPSTSPAPTSSASAPGPAPTSSVPGSGTPSGSGPAVVGAVTAEATGSGVLGTTEVGFTARFGPPGPDSIPGTADHFERVAGTTCDQLVVFFTDRLARAIVGQTCGGPIPTRQDRLAAAGRYAPADRVAGTSFQTANGDPAMTFTSPMLSSRLPASAFHDCNGKSLPAGTFTIFLTADGWEVAAGTCP